VVWGTCHHVGGLGQTFPGSKDMVIESVTKLARTCTDFEVPDCRFD